MEMSWTEWMCNHQRNYKYHVNWSQPGSSKLPFFVFPRQEIVLNSMGKKLQRNPRWGSYYSRQETIFVKEGILHSRNIPIGIDPWHSSRVHFAFCQYYSSKVLILRLKHHVLWVYHLISCVLGEYVTFPFWECHFVLLYVLYIIICSMGSYAS